MKVLVLGVSGMLGSTVFNELSKCDDLDVWGCLRNKRYLESFDSDLVGKIIAVDDLLGESTLVNLLRQVRPGLVLNCIGLIKQQERIADPLVTLPLNSLFPHRLASLCELMNSRLVHFSTDCVFAGTSNTPYTEHDESDARDLYGKSKFIGEVSDRKNTLTIRTSIIGHELATCYSLVDWFLSQNGTVNGFTQAIYTGFPTIEIANILRNVVIPKPDLSGVYHVASNPISKFELLNIIKTVYEKNIEVVPDPTVRINRALNADRFNQETGYEPPSWLELVRKMHSGFVK